VFIKINLKIDEIVDDLIILYRFHNLNQPVQEHHEKHKYQGSFNLIILKQLLYCASF